MKIKFTPNEANSSVPPGGRGSPTEGIGFPAAGEYDVPASAGKYLIETFPQLFSTAEPEPVKAEVAPEKNKAFRAPERNK